MYNQSRHKIWQISQCNYVLYTVVTLHLNNNHISDLFDVLALSSVMDHPYIRLSMCLAHFKQSQKESKGVLKYLT